MLQWNARINTMLCFRHIVNLQYSIIHYYVQVGKYYYAQPAKAECSQTHMQWCSTCHIHIHTGLSLCKNEGNQYEHSVLIISVM